MIIPIGDSWTLAAIIALALAFDYVNGFHDAANSIATVVSTRVLSPRWAVLWAAVFNFIAFLLFDQAVAATVGKGVVDGKAVTLPIIAAGLVGALFWNLLTWYYGIPSSSSHALVGGFAGAAVQAAGLAALKWDGLMKVTLFIALAPLIGLAIGLLLMVAVYWVFHWLHQRVPWFFTKSRIGAIFRRLQLLSAAAYSLGHGGNDAQKTMGIIMALLIAGGQLAPDAKEAPLWVVLSCHIAMGLGTLAGGWRIVKTMGHKLCKMQPMQGACAETAGALMLFGATHFGIPVSTTHTITGAIVGVGAAHGTGAVKWGVAGRLIWAWILTIPCAAAVAAATGFVFALAGWK